MAEKHSSFTPRVRRIALRAALLVAVTLGVGWLLWGLLRTDPVPVSLAKVERGAVEATVTNTRAGTVEACRRAKLAPPVGGQIVRLNVKQGERVKAGTVLLETWNRDAALDARAAEEQAKAAQLRAQEACELAEVAEREAQRAQDLLAEGFVSKERADRMASEARARGAACSAARTEIERARASAGAARAKLDRTVLRAPFAGIVAEVTGELGEYSTPSPPGIPTPPAIDLIDDSCLYVAAPIDEVDAPGIRIGMPGRITLDAFGDRRFPGHVRRIAPYVLDIEKQARTVNIEVEFDNPEQIAGLLVGYSADVEVILDVHEEVLRIPTQALLEGNRVLVYDPASGTLQDRRVKIGISNWEHTEIVEGLQASERVVVSLAREGVGPGAQAVPEGDAQ